MPRFAANLSWLFLDAPFLARFERAARAGFRAVEFLYPEGESLPHVKAHMEACGVEIALFNAPAGNWGAGDRGLAAVPGRQDEFRESIQRAIEFSHLTGCKRIHVMAGMSAKGVSREALTALYLNAIDWAAQQVAGEGITLMLEPINQRDMPGYFLADTRQARDILALLGRDNVKLQLDLYHAQVQEGNLATLVRECLPITGHIQIAGNPGRHEPDVGEIHYPFLFDLIDQLGYSGWIGCEYKPRAATEAGLGWGAGYGLRAA